MVYKPTDAISWFIKTQCFLNNSYKYHKPLLELFKSYKST